MDGLNFVTAPGAAVKAVGRSGLVEGYLVKFGGSGDLSKYRDIFLKSTDFGRRRTSDAYVHHRALPGLGERQLKNDALLEPDDIGVFCKLLLDISDAYEAALYKLVQAGKLGWSSGTAAHLVVRHPVGDGTHKIARWPLGLDASLTPSPAGGMGTQASAAMKSLLGGVGVSLDTAPRTVYFDNGTVREIEPFDENSRYLKGCRW